MARFERLHVYQTLLNDGLMPLFHHASPDVALKVVEALYRAGCRTFGFTNRLDGAVEVFSVLVAKAAESCPEMIIDVSAVEDPMMAALFISRGASFVDGPSLSIETARLCNRHKIAYIPGCGSVTEIALAEEYGAEIIRVFPGNAVGGPDFIKAILQPRPWSKLMPSGGIGVDRDNLTAWFRAGAAMVGMGSALTPNMWVDRGDFDSITNAAAQTLAHIRSVRRPTGMLGGAAATSTGTVPVVKPTGS